MPFIDSHAHIDGQKFAEDRGAVIQRALDNGVEVIVEICNGDVERGSLEEGIAIAEAYPLIYAAVGLHPHDAKLWDDAMESRLRNLAHSPKVIAWGEIGLDFHYNHSEPDVQRNVFRRQLEIACELNLPVVIHSREANRETIDILRENRHSKEKAGIFHCFSGDMEMALAAIDLGFMISFAGSLTFKKAADLRAVAKELPLDRLLIETDCPFLTPEPHRGKRNEPSFVTQVARQIGELKSISADGNSTSLTTRKSAWMPPSSNTLALVSPLAMMFRMPGWRVKYSSTFLGMFEDASRSMSPMTSRCLRRLPAALHRITSGCDRNASSSDSAIGRASLIRCFEA